MPQRISKRAYWAFVSLLLAVCPAQSAQTGYTVQVGDTPCEIAETMEQAVARAAAEAQPGETVLLAPAAASFDQYPNFEKRGEHFTALVQALTAR